MTITHIPSRGLTALGAVLSSALLITACGGGSPEETEAADAADAGFPVTIDTQFGELEVEEKPERVVVVGSPLDVDILDALGEPAEVYGGWAGEDNALEIAPWTEGLYGEYVEGFIAGNKPDAEAVAAQNPDLIIYFGAGAPLEQGSYDQLSEIAPTYAYANLPTYQEEIENIGKLTGTTDRVDEVTGSIDEDFAEAREKLSGLQGKTFFQGIASADGIYSINGAANFFEPLGFKPSDNQPTGDMTQTLSPEKLDEIDADIVVLGGEDEPRQKLEDDSRFDSLPAVKNGTMVIAGSKENYLPMPTQIGPSSVPFILDKLVPQLKDSKLNQEG